MNGLLIALCEYLHQGLTLTSFLLERCLSQLHSAIYTTLSSLFKINAETTAIDRAWWDTRKGSAVVVWASGDQSISQALSISLASIRAKSGSKRAGRPPYTVIVVLPSASWGLPSLISSWATKKARIESGKEAMRGRGLNITSWDVFGLGSLSLRLGSPESHSSEANSDEEKDSIPHKNPSDGSSSPGSRPSTPGKRRRLSFGNWSADVVGYGKDMLKGLQIGQAEFSGIGAVIPVVADTSTPKGVHHAYSTIRAYCTSHNLLLRGLIVLPSVMNSIQSPSSSSSPTSNTVRLSKESLRSSSSSQGREMTAALETEETHQLSGLSSLSNNILYSTRAALLTDVGEAMNVVASLAPALKSDGGRVIAVIPAAFRRVHVNTSQEIKGGQANDDELEFNITRRAMLEMWSGLSKKLANENVQVSQIHMSSPSNMHHHHHSVIAPTKSAKLRSSAPSKERFLPSQLQRLARGVMSQVHYILYPAPCKTSEWKSHLDRSFAPREYGGEVGDVEDDTTSLCPALLLEAVRSVLVRSWPRKHYYVGLGPRLENVWDCVPGHGIIQDWIQNHL